MDIPSFVKKCGFKIKKIFFQVQLFNKHTLEIKGVKSMITKLKFALISILIVSFFQVPKLNAGEMSRNAISFQPLGLFFLWSNIEYERYISNFENMSFTLSGRIVFTTPSMGLSIFKDYFPDMWKGVGFSGRFYMDKDKMTGSYLGFNLDYLSSTGDKVFSWLAVEIGHKWTTGRNRGLFITPSLLGYIALSNEGGFKSISYYAGVAIGYQF